MSCTHGWGGASVSVQICTPCPACGLASLFIGNGGHLTCGSLRCTEPSVLAEINNLRAALEDGLLTLIAISTQPATADRLWGENPTLAATLARMRKALRQVEPVDPIARRDGFDPNIRHDAFPRQGVHLGARVRVCFQYHTGHTLTGSVVRDDVEIPYVTIIRLDDGRFVLAKECPYTMLAKAARGGPS